MIRNLVSGALNSFTLSFLMSAWITWRNLGLSSEFIEHWLSAFVSAWPVALCLLLVIRKPMAALANLVLGEKPDG